MATKLHSFRYLYRMGKAYLFCFSVIALTIFACKKEDSSFDERQINIEFSQETSMANIFSAKIHQISRKEIQYIESIEELALDETEEIKLHDSCAAISYFLDSNNAFVSYAEIIYNDTSCSYLGRKKFGKLKVYLTGTLNKVGTRMTIIPEGFFLNGKKVEGTIIVNNIGLNDDFLFEWRKEVFDGKIWLNSSQYFTWNSNTFITLDFFHQEMIYETEASLISRNGRTYTIETVEPLISEFNCRYFQFGELELKSDWGLHQRINFGYGDCDNKAILWEDSREVEVNLH